MSEQHEHKLTAETMGAKCVICGAYFDIDELLGFAEIGMCHTHAPAPSSKADAELAKLVASEIANVYSVSVDDYEARANANGCGIDAIAQIPEVAAALAAHGTESGEATNCIWMYDDEGYYKTSCGEAFTINDGSPAENNGTYILKT